MMACLSHRNSRVSANIVYNEYIAHKEHIHMNATRWTTLTEFIKHLGREGICEVDETPKGWFLTYRPEDKEEKMRQAMKAKRKVAEEEEDDRNARLIREQIERANAALPEHAKRHAEATELDENAKGELKLSLAGVKRIKTAEELDRIAVRRVMAAGSDWAVLDLAVNAQAKWVRQAYRDLARRLHPDKCKAPGAKDAFQKLSRAYQNISANL